MGFSSLSNKLIEPNFMEDTVHGVIDVVYTHREELLFSTHWNPDVANEL